MKKFCSIVLSIIFAVAFLGTTLLGIVRKDFSYSAITKMAGEILKPVSKAEPVNDGLFHPGDITYSLAGYEDFGDYGDFDFSAIDLDSIDFTNLDVNELVQTYLDAAGVEVEPEFIAEVLASPEVSDFVDKYAGEVIGYMTGTNAELTINADDIKKVMNKSLDMYEEHTGEVVDRTGLDEAIEANVEVAQTEITAALDTAKEENAETFEILKKVEFFLSLKFFLICVGVCVLLALIILLINRNIFACLVYVFMPVFIDGVLIFIAALVAQGIAPGLLNAALADAGLPKGIFEGVWSYISTVLAHLKICGIICAVCGTALWVTGVALGKKTKKAA